LYGNIFRDCEKIYANLKERKGGNEGKRVRRRESNRPPYHKEEGN